VAESEAATVESFNEISANLGGSAHIFTRAAKQLNKQAHWSGLTRFKMAKEVGARGVLGPESVAMSQALSKLYNMRRARVGPLESALG
jgi:hypothetical protein